MTFDGNVILILSPLDSGVKNYRKPGRGDTRSKIAPLPYRYIFPAFLSSSCCWVLSKRLQTSVGLGRWFLTKHFIHDVPRARLFLLELLRYEIAGVLMHFSDRLEKLQNRAARIIYNFLQISHLCRKGYCNLRLYHATWLHALRSDLNQFRTSKITFYSNILDCLQSAFSLKIRLVLISSSAIANHAVII